MPFPGSGQDAWSELDRYASKQKKRFVFWDVSQNEAIFIGTGSDDDRADGIGILRPQGAGQDQMNRIVETIRSNHVSTTQWIYRQYASAAPSLEDIGAMTVDALKMWCKRFGIKPRQMKKTELQSVLSGVISSACQ